ANLFWRGHASYSAFGADLRRDALQRHHRYRSGALGDLRLFRVGYVHDHAALEHLGEPGLEAKVGVVSVVLRHGFTLFWEQLSAVSYQLSAQPFMGAGSYVALTSFYSPFTIRGTPWLKSLLPLTSTGLRSKTSVSCRGNQ